MTTRKICAVCKSRTQSNIIHRWQRHSDGKVFHVCASCAEDKLVASDTVQEIRTEEYSSYMTKDEFDAEKYNKVRGINKRNKKYMTVSEYVKRKQQEQ